MFHPMYDLKGEGGRKIPQISHLRDKMYETKVPPVKMEIGFQNKASGEVTVLEDVHSSPVSRFPPSTYKCLYEIAYVDVSNNSFLYSLYIFNKLLRGGVEGSDYISFLCSLRK